MILPFFSCEKPKLLKKRRYSFFVAGHVYGTPGSATPGIYPLFKDKFEYIKNQDSMAFGIFLGDIVIASTKAEWDTIDKDIDKLGLPVYFAIGNHDNKNRKLFVSRYGETYYSFSYQNDFFIILDPNIDGWNISEEQLDFLQSTVNSIEPWVENIFVCFHQLLWWSPDNKYSNISPNSLEGRNDSINFWEEVEPLFRNRPQNVYMFAGDVGAASWSADYMFDRYENITLIATGMGEGEGDNFIIVDIMSDNSVKLRLLSLDCEDINCLGNIEDYKLP